MIVDCQNKYMNWYPLCHLLIGFDYYSIYKYLKCYHSYYIHVFCQCVIVLFQINFIIYYS